MTCRTSGFPQEKAQRCNRRANALLPFSRFFVALREFCSEFAVRVILLVSLITKNRHKVLRACDKRELANW